MGSGVINGHLSVAGGRDAANMVMNLTRNYTSAANTWAARANEPGTQNNVPGSAVATGALWVFGGCNPFIAEDGPKTTAAFIRPTVKLGLNDKVEAPETTSSTLVYYPTTDSWSVTS